MTYKEPIGTQEARGILGVSRSTLNRLAKEGTLPSIRVGRSNVYDRADVEAFAAARRKEVASA